MFNRFKRLWALSRKDPKLFENISPEDISKLPDAPNGQAIFIPEGTQEDYEEMLKEDSGISKWYKRIRDL